MAYCILLITDLITSSDSDMEFNAKNAFYEMMHCMLEIVQRIHQGRNVNKNFNFLDKYKNLEYKIIYILKWH